MWEKNIYKNSNSSSLEIFSGFQTYGSFGHKHSDEIDILKKAITKNFNVIVRKPLPREKLFEELKNQNIFVSRK